MARFRHPTSAIKHGAGALAAAAVIAAGTQAYASPVRFDNPPGPGHFVWPHDGPYNNLTVTLPASDLPFPTNPNGSFRHVFYPQIYGYVGRASPFTNVETVLVSGKRFVAGADPGDMIPTCATFAVSGYTSYYALAGFAGGIEKYLGVRFDLGSGYHYGWIGVVRDGPQLDAFAWGYETEPGVPICAGAGGADNPDCSTCDAGDLDGDGDTDTDDIPHFVDALLGNAEPPGIDHGQADMDCGGEINGEDVQPFVDKLLE